MLRALIDYPLTRFRAGMAAGLLAFAGPVLAQSGPTVPADPLALRVHEATLAPAGGPPQANVTSFAGALRCMDGLMRTFGARGVAVVVEDIPDATTKVKAGAKEMFTSATSAMTRSSRGIRLIPWNAGSAVAQGRDDVLRSASFAVQGSVSQFDDATLRRQRDGAICLGPLCIGAAESDSFSGLSLDLSMIELEGLTLIPGVVSKNYVLIRRKGRGVDGDLSLEKFGVQYNFTFSSSDGQGQALRSLVELGAIELYGRLLKIPYWTCLGRTDRDPGVSLEIEDWWDTLRGDVPSLVSYLQVQMTARGLYAGPVDGRLNDELDRAIRATKQAMGLTPDLNVDLGFFRAYLAADHAQLQTAAAAALKAIEAREGPLGRAPGSPATSAAAALAPGGTTPAAAGPPPLSITNRKGPAHVARRGEPVEIDVAVVQAGFLYCFLLDEGGQLTQFFPNPTQPSAAVPAGARIAFPGAFGFRIVASRNGATETIACLRTAKDLGPQALGPRPSSPGGIGSLRQQLIQRAGGPVDMEVFDVKVQ